MPLICEYSGHDSDFIKLYLKQKFGWMKTETVFGEVMEVPMSTAEMTTSEFEKFMTQIRQWGDTIGVYLPEPNEIS